MNELVVLKNKEAVCSSVQVAEYFEKRHKNVIQNIQRLAENSADVKKMFASNTYYRRRIYGF